MIINNKTSVIWNLLAIIVFVFFVKITETTLNIIYDAIYKNWTVIRRKLNNKKKMQLLNVLYKKLYSSNNVA